jgi:glycosyltransferase involved in cell wall biosynthesis
VTLSVLAPVRDEGPSFREHVRACLGAVAYNDVEVVVMDNQSIDGCCHGLPREVLIIRTERVESPARLWGLGESLAQGERLLWLPRLNSVEPDQFRAIVTRALEFLEEGEPSDSDCEPRRLSFAVARKGPALLTLRARSRLASWRRIPLVGGLLSAAALRWLRLVIALETGESVVNVAARVKAARPPAPSLHDTHAEQTQSCKSAKDLGLARCGPRRLSVIITAYNEGAEVIRTVQSVRASTRSDHEIIVVDDGSTDGSCSGLEELGVRVIRHTQRIGVAYSRAAGSRAAVGDVFAYLDAHQRVEPGCLDRCAEVAIDHQAIVCPPCRPLGRRYPVGYGASFAICLRRGFFSARSRSQRPRQEITRISALRSPGYLIARSVYRRVAWIGGLRGWGATDYALALKAFFADVDILHVNAGATQHLFRKRIPYETTWEGVWRNHALIARVCFDDRTWTRYWLPKVFRGNLADAVVRELDSPAVLAERDAFRTDKVRPDREFWRGLLHVPEPEALI